MNTDLLIKELVDWTRAKVEEAGAKGLVFGLSGGIDSAVMAGIAKKAFGKNTMGIIMPCHSNEEDEKDARLVADTLGLEVDKVDLTSVYDELLSNIPIKHENSLAMSNIKPRLRMTSLYYYGQTKGYLVAGPTNLSEFTVGYFTKYGDSAVDIMPLASFVKEEIYELARALGIPEEIIEKTPSAGLLADQSDEKEMGFSYEVLDSHIRNKVDSEYGEKINRMNKNSQHKRQYPPIFPYENR